MTRSSEPFPSLAGYTQGEVGGDIPDFSEASVPHVTGGEATDFNSKIDDGFGDTDLSVQPNSQIKQDLENGRHDTV